MTIGPFKGEWAWLSNMYPCLVHWNGQIHSCVEIPYQASKFEDPAMVEEVLSCKNGYKAKQMARRNAAFVSPTFDDRKLRIMAELCLDKFTRNPDLRQRLIDTGDESIQELNTWGDTYWGVNIHTGQGSNYLGKILMRIREKVSNAYQDLQGASETLE